MITFKDILFFFYYSPPDPLMEPYPHQFATALFSFLYHLASYDAGGEALVSCGMMEALLKVIVLTNIFFPTILCQSVIKITLN